LKLTEKISLKAVRLYFQREPRIAVTVFTIEMLPNNRTLYKLCGRFNNMETRFSAREPRILVTDDESRSSNDIQPHLGPDVMSADVVCENEEAEGHYIFIRDDRKKLELFSICELEVFQLKKDDDDCGDPEIPRGATVHQLQQTVSNDDSYTREREFICNDGLTLYSGNERTTITCSQGMWNSSHVRCEAEKCPELLSIPHGNIFVEFDDYDVMYTAKVECDRGFVTWGHSKVACNEGRWSGPPAECRPLSCGPPPTLDNANVKLTSGSTLWKDEAVYQCGDGFIMVVDNASAQEYTKTICEDDGYWSAISDVKCVNATQLTGAGYLSGPAKISINIIYCLLALLILTCIPVPLLAYFCSRRRNKDKSNPSLEQISNKEEAVTPSEPCDSPKIGIYSVPNGLVLRPATVSPNTLRSLSAVSSFKPFSYTEQPSSLPYHGWTITEAQETPPIPPQIDNEPHSLSNEPIIDEAGYASLIIKREHLYEPVTESSEHNYSNNDRSFEINEHNYANNEHSFEIDEPNYSNNEMGFKITEHNYSNDENKFEINEHNYANVSHEESNEHQESESYPDLLQMVTRDKPSAVSDKPRPHSDTTLSDVSSMYAKVDLSRKHSRPNSDEIDTKKQQDSYTKTLIKKFDLFLQQGGHSQT